MKQSLEIIKNAVIDPNDEKANVLTDLRNLVASITDDYKHPENISDQKYDMTEAIKFEGYSKEDYVEMFGSVMRSEADVVNNLASLLSGAESKPTTSENKASANEEEEKKRKMRMAKAKAAAKLKLAQAELEAQRELNK